MMMENRFQRSFRVVVPILASCGAVVAVIEAAAIARADEPRLDAARTALAAGDLPAAREALAAFVRSGAAGPDAGPEATWARLALATCLLAGEDPNPQEALKVLDDDPARPAKPSVLRSYLLGVARLEAARDILAAPAGELNEHVLVPPGSRWRFFRGFSEPPAKWRQAAFDDARWEEGPAPLGFGDDDDRTVLEDLQGRSASLYLRRGFVVPQAVLDGAQAVVLRIYYDDGFVAHLGGREVARSNVPGAPGSLLHHRTLASQQHEAEGFEEFPLAPSSLAAGRNTLAIQVHQMALASSDLSIDAELVLLERRTPPEPDQEKRLLSGAVDELRSALAAFSRPGAAGPAAFAAAARLDLADAHLLRREHGEAIRLLESALRSGGDAGRRAALYRLGIARLWTGDAAGAGVALSRLVPLGDAAEDMHAAYLLARVHHLLGERPEALALYARGIDGAETSWSGGELVRRQAGLFRAAALFELGRPQDADQALLPLVSSHAGAGGVPDLSAHARLFAAILELERSAEPQVLEKFAAVAASSSEPAFRLRCLLWVARGAEVCQERVAPATREAFLDAVVEVVKGAEAPDLDPPSRRGLDEALARLQALRGDCLGAASRYEALARSAGADGNRFLHRQAVLLGQAGRHAQALEVLERTSAPPQSALEAALRFRKADAHFFLARAAETDGARRARLAQAAAEYRAALDSPAGCPWGERARFHLGLCSLLGGKPREAALELAKLPQAALEGEIAAAAYFRARLLVSGLEVGDSSAISAARALRDLEDTEKLLDGFLRGKPAHVELTPKAALELARVQRVRGQLVSEPKARQEAFSRARVVLGWLRQQLGATPQAAEALLEEGRLRLAEGDFARALGTLARFRSEAPWKDSAAAPQALLELARADRALGRLEEAENILLTVSSKMAQRGKDLDVRGRMLLARFLVEYARLSEDQGHAGFSSLALQDSLALLDQAAGPERVARLRREVAIEAQRALCAGIEERLRSGAQRRESIEEAATSLRAGVESWRRDVLGRDAAGGDALEGEMRLELLHKLSLLERVDVALGRASDEERLQALDALRLEVAGLLGENDRHSVEAQLAVAQALSRLGRTAEALVRIESAYAASITKEVEGEVLLRWGTLLLATGVQTASSSEDQPAHARERAREGLNLLRDAAARSPPLKPLGILAEAWAHARRGDPAAALQACDAAAGLGPDTAARARFLRGVVLALEGNLDEAAGLFRTAASELKGNEERAAALWGLALSLSAPGKAGESPAILDELRGKFPFTAAGRSARSERPVAASVLAGAFGPSGLPVVLEEAVLERRPRWRSASRLDRGAIANLGIEGAEEVLAAEAAALAIQPAPFVEVEPADPLARLEWMRVLPEPEAPSSPPARDAKVLIDLLLAEASGAQPPRQAAQGKDKK